MRWISKNLAMSIASSSSCKHSTRASANVYNYVIYKFLKIKNKQEGVDEASVRGTCQVFLVRFFALRKIPI